MRLSLMMISLAVVTVLMGSVTAFVTTTTTADTITGQTGSNIGSTPSEGDQPICNGSSTAGIPAVPASGASASGAPTSSGASTSRSAPRGAPPLTDIPCPTAGVPYSHSWYITNSGGMAQLGAGDAQWLNRETGLLSCPRGFLTVLDFGHPTRKFGGQTAPLDAYAMTLFGYRDTWRTYHEIEQLAEQYLDAWIGAISSCSHLTLVLGANNYGECQYASGSCNVTTAGQYWDVAVHDVMDYVAGKGYGSQITGVWAGDDIETSWDPWTATARFLDGVEAQERTYTTHTQLVDYGDANVGVCSVVTGSCRASWTTQNVYDAAWNIGWDLPLPELYSPATAGRWESVAHQFPDMQYRGVMTECGGVDPLPLDGCRPGESDATGASGSNACEWSPAIALAYAQRFAQAMPGHRPPAFATNIQWVADPGIPGSGPSGSSTCS